MPIEIRPGVTLPIPCRKCGKITKWKLASGKSSIDCKECDQTTEVVAKETKEGWQVMTGLKPAKIATR